MSYVQYGYRMRSPEEVFFDLQRFLGFSKADLEANRKGVLTPSQHSGLIRQLLRPCAWLAMAILFLLVWLFLPMESLDFLEDLNEDQFIIVPLFLIAGAIYLMPWRVVADIASPHVEKVEGKGDVEMRGVNDHISLEDRREEWAGDEESTERDFENWEDSQQLYHLRIDGFRFPASKQVVNAIEEGHRYRAFYTRYSHRLLSIEPVPDNVTPAGPQTPC